MITTPTVTGIPLPVPRVIGPPKVRKFDATLAGTEKLVTGEETVTLWKAVLKLTPFPLESSAWRVRLMTETGSDPPVIAKLNTKTLKFWPGCTVDNWGETWVTLRDERDPGKTWMGPQLPERPRLAAVAVTD